MISLLSLLILVFINTTSVANETDTIIEIYQPRFSEKGLDQKSYEIKAEKGIRNEGNLFLYKIEGKFKTDNGLWIYLEAKEGSFEETVNNITLTNDVTFYTEFGDRITSDYATFLINEEHIKFSDRVLHESIDAIIESDFITVTNNFSEVKYKGNVITEILYD